MSRALGLLADTIRFSCVDGPGNRYVVFLQGCNFDCVACHNPWTINTCSSCGECLPACPAAALAFDSSGTVVWAAERCDGAERCIAVCPESSTPKARVVSVDEVLAGLREVAPFVSGLTVSGGEPTQQASFLHELFAAVKADVGLAPLTTFVDSNGSAPAQVWDRLLPVLDGAMIDLKALDPDVHLGLTGATNDAVLASIRHLAAAHRLHEVRLLLVPGRNDGADDLRRTAAWLLSVDRAVRVKVIGFRHHGARPAARAFPEATPESLDAAAAVLREEGVRDLVVV